jgi:hypothetical protein
MSRMRLLKTGFGDQCVAEWDVDRPETITPAERAWHENFLPGRMAFRIDGPGQSNRITNFDRLSPEILIVPAIQGG